MRMIGAEAFKEGQDDRPIKRPRTASIEPSDEEEEEETVEFDASQSQDNTGAGRSTRGRTKQSRPK